MMPVMSVPSVNVMQVERDYTFAEAHFNNTIPFAAAFFSIVCTLNICNVSRVPTLPGKPWDLEVYHTFAGLENAWNLLKEWEILGIWIQTWTKLAICKFCVLKIHFSICYLQNIFIYIFLISILSTQTLWYGVKLTWDFMAFIWK